MATIKKFMIKDLKAKAKKQTIDPRFDRVGIIYAEGGTNSVDIGGENGLRRFVDKPEEIINSSVDMSSPAPMTTAELFDQNYLSVDPQLLSSLSQAKVCISRGSLVKLLHVADLEFESLQYKNDFVFNITKRKYLNTDHTYLVVEDTAGTRDNAAYGHTIANRLTTPVDEKHRGWRHYDYNLVGLGDNFDGLHYFSILLRNQVDAVTEDGLHVEIKSHNAAYRSAAYRSDKAKFPPYMVHDALVVLTGQAAALSLVHREGNRIVEHLLYTRENLKEIVPKDTYLKLLGIVKLLLIGVVAEMGPFEKAQLVFKRSTSDSVFLKPIPLV
eukprot:gene10854-12062_t